MLAFALAVALQTPKFQPIYICSIKEKVFSSFVYCAVLTEKETVAGYRCESVGHHGETDFATPFVWSKGVLTNLPLPKEAEYGQVRGGDDSQLLGSVMMDYRNRPVVWTPDPFQGWAKPKLRILSMKEGQATHLGPDGTIWIQSGNKIVAKIKDGKWEAISFGNFDLHGIDANGRMFGNQFKGMHFGLRPADTTPGMFVGKSWTALKTLVASTDFGGDSYLSAANAKGDATGNCQNQATLWKGSEVSFLAKGERRWSYGADINDRGAVVGRCSVEGVSDSAAFLWKDGKLTDLSKTIAGIELDSAMQINNRGVIAVSGTKARVSQLYILRPQ